MCRVVSAVMHEAVAQAARAGGKYRHGAVLADGDRIVAAAYNTDRLHAERRAFMKCPRHLLKDRRAGLTLYVARLTPRDELALSKPCSACEAIIRAMTGVRKVVYTTS